MSSQYEMPPAKRSVDNVRAASDGWYVVDVAFNRQNPIHRTLMEVSARGSRAVIPSTSVEDAATPVSALHFLRVVRAVDLS